MANATILSTDMSAWPPTTYLVQLDEPLKRYDPETGEPEEFEYVALTVQEAEPRQSYIFPANADGGFVDGQMIPMRRRDYGLPHSILMQLGYTLTG